MTMVTYNKKKKKNKKKKTEKTNSSSGNKKRRQPPFSCVYQCLHKNVGVKNCISESKKVAS